MTFEMHSAGPSSASSVSAILISSRRPVGADDHLPGGMHLYNVETLPALPSDGLGVVNTLIRSPLRNLAFQWKTPLQHLGAVQMAMNRAVAQGSRFVKLQAADRISRLQQSQQVSVRHLPFFPARLQSAQMNLDRSSELSILHFWQFL